MPFNQINTATGEIDYGVTPRTAEEILKLLNQRVLENLSLALGTPTTIDTSDVSEVGRLNKIFADRLAAVWEETEMIEGSFYVNEAFGISLSKLALLVGFIRNSSTYSVGELRVFGDDKTLVPAQTTFASIRGDEFINVSEFEINLTACLSFFIRVGVNKAGREYSVTVDTKEYKITSASADHFSILTQLAGVLDDDSTITVTLSADLDEDSYIQVVKIQQPNTVLPMNVEVSPLLIPYTVEVEQQVRAKNKGVVFGDADTIVEILNTVTGLDSVYNPSDFELGRANETDEELRERIVTDYQSVGSATPTSIEARLRNLDTVRSIFIDYNRTFKTSATAVPAKAYEVIISHVDSDQNIAQMIWDTKPAGIATHGVTSVTITDSSGTDQTVKFTNAQEVFAHVKVSYKTTSDEGEEYPISGDQIIREAVTTEGDNYTINQDVIGKRFYAPIFENVTGIGELIVEVCVLPTPITDPLDPSLVWVSKASISRTQIATFATNRVFVYDIT